MKQAELAQYRAMLQAQAAEPARRGLFGARPKPALAPAVVLASVGAGGGAVGGPPPRRGGSLFGRRPPEPTTALAVVEPLVLDMPVGAVGRLRLSAPAGSHHLSETPYHADDLADAATPAGPTPGVIAGWSNAKPLSAQVRLLRRLEAVVEAERQGLDARLAVAEVNRA